HDACSAHVAPRSPEEGPRGQARLIRRSTGWPRGTRPFPSVGRPISPKPLTIHRLERFADLLAHWQKRTNLVAPSTLPTLWSRHFADSAQLTTLAPKARLWLDLGTGAGFPGLVIAILKTGTPDFRMHLVESNRKKCAFLAEVARAT